jgi:hypothetical protein
LMLSFVANADTVRTLYPRSYPPPFAGTRYINLGCRRVSGALTPQGVSAETGCISLLAKKKRQTSYPAYKRPSLISNFDIN